jgi:hypothetical protein
MDNIEYHFHHSDGSSDSIIVSTNARHEIVVPDEFQPPDWTLLANQQCSNCTLSPEEKRYCPIARNIAYLFSGISGERLLRAGDHGGCPQRGYLLG